MMSSKSNRKIPEKSSIYNFFINIYNGNHGMYYLKSVVMAYSPYIPPYIWYVDKNKPAHRKAVGWPFMQSLIVNHIIHLRNMSQQTYHSTSS